MSDPRAYVRYDGIEQVRVTVPIDDSTITYSSTSDLGSASVGLAVTLNSSEQVALAADGEVIFGRLEEVTADNMAVVTIEGFVELPAGTSAALTNGKKIVGDLLVAAKGYIREVNTATAAELGLARGMIVDPTTTTAVVVKL